MPIISEVGVDISRRFFEAIETLKTQKRIRGLQTFTRNHNLHRWNVNRVKFYPEKHILKPEWIYYLNQDYKVSVKWIILGKGHMFEE